MQQGCQSAIVYLNDQGVRLWRLQAVTWHYSSMTPENSEIPDWARQERVADLAWIAENLDVFWTTATAAFEDVGLETIIIGT